MTLPDRRYAMFTDLIHGDYIIVVNGDDIERAPYWGGFVRWIGETKPAVTLLKGGV